MVYIVYIFAITIPIISITYFIKIFTPIRKTIKELVIVNNELEKIKSNVRNINNIKMINEIINNKTVIFIKEWSRYESIISNQKNTNNILDPAQYLDTESILDRYSNRKLAENFPNLLTGTGIFGTFLGLVMGLWNLDSLGITVLRDQIPVLIGGMKISFISSLVAIFFALTWTYFEKNISNKLNILICEFNNKMQILLPIRNESNLLEEIVDNQRKQLNATKEFISDTLIPELVNGLQAAVEKTIAPEISKMNVTVEKLADVSTNKQAESLDKMVDKFMNTFNEAFDYQFDALKETLEEVIIWQKNTKNEMEELITTIERNAESQNNLLLSTENLLGNMQAYVSEFDKLHQNLNVNVRSLNEITGQLNNIEGKINNKLSLMVTEYSKMEKRKNEEIQRLEHQIEAIDIYWGSVKKEFNNLNNNLSSSINNFTDNITNGLKRTFELFDDNLSEISKRLGITIKDINDMVQELPDSINLLITTIGEFENNQVQLLNEINFANKKLDQLKDGNKGFFSRLGGR